MLKPDQFDCALGIRVRVLALLLAWIAAGPVGADTFSAPYSTAEVRFIKSDGDNRSLHLEVAVTEAQRQRGLMFRRQIADGEGMVFLYHPPQIAAMWMKNTLVPLDMVFVNAAGRIVYIAAQTEPLSLTPISAGVAVQLVIELAGGNCDRLGLRVGDRVELNTAEATSGSSAPR